MKEYPYSTGELVRAARVSLRDVQWWIQRGLLKPRMTEGLRGGRGGYCRRWTGRDVWRAALIRELAERGFQTKWIRARLAGLMSLAGAYLVIAGDAATWVPSKRAALKLAAEVAAPVFLITRADVEGTISIS
jgi:DNA-binding transcriptional MerR regulator